MTHTPNNPSTVCPYCDGPSGFLVASTDRNRHTTDASFSYFQCDGCGLVFMDPIPSDMRPFYAGGYQEIPKRIEELRSLAEPEKYRLKPILKYKNGGELLEIGPWIGIFSCNAKDAGFNVTAIDIDQSCVNFLNDTVGIHAMQSTDPAETLAAMHQKFDVIALWHCLEHLPSPWLVVQRAAELLAPGGILLIAIPNIESYEFASLGAGWRHLDTPRHIYFYPAQSLVELGKANGLVALEVDTNDELSDVLRKDTWYTWAAAKLPIRYLRGALGFLAYRNARTKRTQKYAGAGLTVVLQRPVSPQ